MNANKDIRQHLFPARVSDGRGNPIARQLSPALLAVAMGCAIVPAPARADWPQILGPNRDGVAAADNSVPRWSDDDPKPVWEYPVGQGYAGVAVASDRVILFHRRGNDEIVECLGASTGKPMWRHDWPTRFDGGYDPDAGPRCVPLIRDDSVYLHGAGGTIVCVGLTDGRPRWTRDTAKDFGAREGYFGAASSPILEQDKLIVNVGGRDQASVIALDAKTGKTVWTTWEDEASYSSPIATAIAGRRWVLMVTRLHFVGIDPQSGKIGFQVPFGRSGPTVNGAMPLLVSPHQVFLTASYGVGARLVDIDDGAAKVVYERDDLMSSQYATGVVHDGVLYGLDGREDVGTPQLRAIDPLTGKVFWTKPDFGAAALILVDDAVVSITTKGDCIVLAADRHAYRELSRVRLRSGLTRALPALSSGRLYVRDDRRLACFTLTGNAAAE
ncbi:MAG: PQQ-binding-like beta-propeller repeat protein [Pirellulaceae bacterium]|nr:PQQ-like beta-propeller repeat protein [Planctomycetales bacterium]